MAKILHTADFHLDSAFTALPEEKARLRRQEARQLTDRLVDYANDHGVELLLLAGDLFDSDQLYGQTAQELAQSLARFRGHAVIAPGNHDFYAASSPYARLLWPENVHIFREERLQRLPFPQYGCVVYGAAFTSPDAPAGIPGSLGPEDEGLARILLLHGEVGVRDSRYRAMTLKDVEQSGADYLALGAVGSTTLLVSLFTGLLIGIGSGVNVVVARGLGLGSHEDVEKTIHTSLLICSGIGIVVCLVCLLLAKPMLLLLNTKEELLPGAVGYLRIYALGMPAMAVYNFGNGVLSAAGDTKRPLLYLSIAGVVNVALNLFFVIQCHMAALGVATASAIAQWLSALLIMRHLMSQKDACGVHLKKLCIDKAAAKRVLMIGIPSGLQNAIFALANLFVQIGVNSFDSVMVSGSSAAANADTLIFNMMSAFYTGCATFVSRNWGAGKTDRILKSYRIVLLYSFLVGSICGGLLLLFGDKFLGLFANEADVIAAGMQRLKIMGFSFGVSALMDASIAASRGIGRSIVPTIIVIMGSCVFRVIWVYTVFTYFGTIPSLFLLYIFSWAITGIAEWAYFRHSYKKYILHGQIW